MDYFLKSLANHKIDLKTLDRLEPDRDVVFRSCKGNEDGRFKISDIHENGTFLVFFCIGKAACLELQAISLVMTITMTWPAWKDAIPLGICVQEEHTKTLWPGWIALKMNHAITWTLIIAVSMMRNLKIWLEGDSLWNSGDFNFIIGGLL